MCLDSVHASALDAHVRSILQGLRLPRPDCAGLRATLVTCSRARCAQDEEDEDEGGEGGEEPGTGEVRTGADADAGEDAREEGLHPQATPHATSHQTLNPVL